MMEPIENRILYCFKLDDITGKIIQYEISDYRVERNRYASDRDEFCFRASLGQQSLYYYRVKRHKLDRLVNNKVFTFHDDNEEVLKVILKDLERKKKEAGRIYDYCNNLISKVDKMNK